MPELPEVETIARGLQHNIVGKTIKRVVVGLPKMAVTATATDFSRTLRGDTVTLVDRRGKYAVLHLKSGRSLVTSLRMTGRLVVQPAGEKAHPYTKIALYFTDGTRLSFADVRQFGRMRLIGPGEPWDKALGPEPLSGDFTPKGFIGMLAGRRTPVKVVLLDQRRIAGIGNIYACEALWEARIRPSTPANALSAPAVRRLHSAIVDVLTRAIEMRGTSVDDYVDSQGLKGGFQNVLRVYGRAGRPCERCGKPLIRTVLGQRGTWWCAKCQR